MSPLWGLSVSGCQAAPRRVVGYPSNSWDAHVFLACGTFNTAAPGRGRCSRNKDPAGPRGGEDGPGRSGRRRRRVGPGGRAARLGARVPCAAASHRDVPLQEENGAAALGERQVSGGGGRPGSHPPGADPSGPRRGIEEPEAVAPLPLRSL